MASVTEAEDIVSILDFNAYDIDSTDKWGNTALMCALEQGHDSSAALLLQMDADVSRCKQCEFFSKNQTETVPSVTAAF